MKKILSAVAILGLVSSLYANSNTGCGLGSIVIKNQNSTVLQALAATTNATSGNQTFGITSGTSNCNKPSNFVSNDKLNQFVNENMDELAMDISAGKGETLNTVAALMNIENKEDFASKLQANFSDIYTSEKVTSAEVIDNIAKHI
ncbi:DUF3015 family protein [Aliarcobacter cibarius]|jgi:hypothetical protein|uniref:DUF3015 domain-containing protein n=1 Tax=Aliarcobacter cibarius TaxID=255507 RepID=A0A5J6RMQ9_9BACT|nr:DUF3015 family protein [Aliarcobacter cibarius]QEZ89731.1 DUF3015 domain-containing protein [Aliarcobacter cibarius]QKJ27741.1 DUF3015 domain-containing protein [Aliarcobacter cibarius]TLT01106.1 DUF3015 domain-containing protein [Aliarcobacter cibarius]TLT01203.1 DUF3015 domain-containing protein [Aliarcobacter cibarius]TLT04998.1 DUF3015 domain-containing protein [Aliarcobacter cibarius]